MRLWQIMQLGMKRTVLVCVGCISTPPLHQEILMMEALIANIYVYTPRSKSLSLSLSPTLYCFHSTILNVPCCPFTTLLPPFAPFATLHCYKFLHQSGKSNSNFEKQKYGTPATISSFVSSYWIISLRFNSRSTRERRGWGGGVGDEWTKALTTSRLQQPLAVL